LVPSLAETAKGCERGFPDLRCDFDQLRINFGDEEIDEFMRLFDRAPALSGKASDRFIKREGRDETCLCLLEAICQSFAILLAAQGRERGRCIDEHQSSPERGSKKALSASSREAGYCRWRSTSGLRRWASGTPACWRSYSASTA